MNSLVCGGVVVSGGTVRRSILSPGVRIHFGALVEDSVILDDVDIGRGAVVRCAIIDKRVRVPAEYQLGVDHEADARCFAMSTDGIVAVGKGDDLGSLDALLRRLRQTRDQTHGSRPATTYRQHMSRHGVEGDDITDLRQTIETVYQ